MMSDTIDLPTFRSCALDDLPRPDHCDVQVVQLPGGASVDPRTWARTMFSPAGTPAWVRAALGARQVLVPLLGIPRADPDQVFRVSRVVGEEALIAVDDVHLDFRCAVGVDARQGLVRCTTAVRLKNLRGRVYFAPVRLGHGPVVQSMLRRTAIALTP
jgi:hypothetical protein